MSLNLYYTTLGDVVKSWLYSDIASRVCMRIIPFMAVDITFNISHASRSLDTKERDFIFCERTSASLWYVVFIAFASTELYYVMLFHCKGHGDECTNIVVLVLILFMTKNLLFVLKCFVYCKGLSTIYFY